MDSDEVLVRLAQLGDHDTFGQLMERHFWLLRHIAWRMVGSTDLIDDLLQEA